MGRTDRQGSIQSVPVLELLEIDVVELELLLLPHTDTEVIRIPCVQGVCRSMSFGPELLRLERRQSPHLFIRGLRCLGLEATDGETTVHHTHRDRLPIRLSQIR